MLWWKFRNLLAYDLDNEKEKSWLFNASLIILWDVFNLFPARGHFRCQLFQGDAVWKDIRIRWARSKAIWNEEGAVLSELLRMCFVTVFVPIGTRCLLPSFPVMHLGWKGWGTTELFDAVGLSFLSLTSVSKHVQWKNIPVWPCPAPTSLIWAAGMVVLSDTSANCTTSQILFFPFCAKSDIQQPWKPTYEVCCLNSIQIPPAVLLQCQVSVSQGDIQCKYKMLMVQQITTWAAERGQRRGYSGPQATRVMQPPVLPHQYGIYLRSHPSLTHTNPALGQTNFQYTKSIKRLPEVVATSSSTWHLQLNLISIMAAQEMNSTHPGG